MNKTEITFALALLAGSTSASFATEFDANLANRYAANSGNTTRTFQSAPVRLQQAPAQRQFYVPQAPIDRDSVPHAGGVG
jgi:hypothetical protein